MVDREYLSRGLRCGLTAVWGSVLQAPDLTIGSRFAGALLLGQRRREWTARVRGVRSRRARFPGLRLRQLHGTRRQGQGCARAAVLPGRRRTEGQGDPGPLFGSPLQGDGREAARREGDSRGHGAALAQRGRDRSDELRHGACGVGCRGGEHQRSRRRSDPGPAS